jgi:hypothetical protein
MEGIGTIKISGWQGNADGTGSGQNWPDGQQFVDKNAWRETADGGQKQIRKLTVVR